MQTEVANYDHDNVSVKIYLTAGGEYRVTPLVPLKPPTYYSTFSDAYVDTYVWIGTLHADAAKIEIYACWTDEMLAEEARKYKTRGTNLLPVGANQPPLPPTPPRPQSNFSGAGNIVGIDDDVVGQDPADCAHIPVQVGFVHNKVVCKVCDVELPNE